MKLDIQKYFPSIDHRILLNLLRRKIKDRDVLWLAGRIIDGSNPQESVYHLFPGDDLLTPLERRRGLPLGNQTSQFFANVYLDPLDHFIADRLGMPCLRYVDDLLVFSRDKRQLAEVRVMIGRFLQKFRLRLHEKKSVIFPCSEGIPFLGYRIFPTHRRLAKSNLKRFRHRMRRMQELFAAGLVSEEKLRERIQSWIAHAAHADTERLRERVLGDFVFARNAPERRSAA